MAMLTNQRVYIYISSYTKQWPHDLGEILSIELDSVWQIQIEREDDVATNGWFLSTFSWWIFQYGGWDQWFCPIFNY